MDEDESGQGKSKKEQREGGREQDKGEREGRA
jgi:hypothetical protein